MRFFTRLKNLQLLTSVFGGRPNLVTVLLFAACFLTGWLFSSNKDRLLGSIAALIRLSENESGSIPDESTEDATGKLSGFSVSPRLIEAKLLATSDLPPGFQNGPYESALVVQKFQNLKTNEIVQVAQVGMYRRVLQRYFDSVGEICELELVERRDWLEIASLQIIDSLPFDDNFHGGKFFINSGQELKIPKINGYPNTVMDEKVQKFTKICGEVTVATIGDSRVDQGGLPSKINEIAGFEGKAFNFAIAGTRLPYSMVVLRDYLMEATELKIVIIGLSPRMFNVGEHQRAATSLLSSNAYAEFMASKPICGAKKSRSDSIITNGVYDEFGELKEPVNAPENFDLGFKLKVKRALSSSKYYEIDESKIQLLENMIRLCRARKICLYGFTPPAHGVTGDSVAANDGIGREVYKKLMERFIRLSEEYPGTFFFKDIDRAGCSGLEDANFRDVDHLSRQGAETLTGIVGEWVKR